MPESPIHNIPDDILHEIFIHCQPDDRWLIGLAPLDVPVLLTHICQRWRKVALGSPTLWNRLRWDVGIRTLDSKQLNIFATAAARARSSPRILQVNIRRSISSFAEAQRTRFVPLPDISNELLLPAAPSLIRPLPRGVPIEQIHAIPSGSFPHLIRLALYLDGAELEMFPWENRGLVKAFSDAPALRRVALSSSPFYDYQQKVFMVDQIQLPWEQLSHVLDFAPQDQQPVFDYLSRCEQLQYLFAGLSEDGVAGEDTANWSSDVRPVKTLVNLESVSLYYLNCFTGAISYPTVLDAFEFPNLKALRLDGGKFDIQDPEDWTDSLANRFLSKIGQLNCLTYLSICPTSVDSYTLRQIILATPHVKTLDGFIYENYENFFESIVWNL